MDTPEDAAFGRAAGGDPDALDELLQRYLPQLHAFVAVRLGPALRARESSLDVVQSVCREALEERGRFDFRGEDRFRAWLFTAALNKVRERHRRMHAARRDAGRETALDDERIADALASLITPSQDAVGRETGRALRDALAALSEEHREVITLARVVRLPHRVIAEMLSRNEVATRQLLARALVRLTGELRRRGVDLSAWSVG